MMTKIREKTHILLWILVFCFIALIVIEWGANYSDIARTKRGIIGKVNGEDVRYADFQTVYYNQIQQMQQQKNESLSESEMEQVSDQIWGQITEEMLLRDFIKDNAIAVGDSEVVFHLRNNPPDFLRQSPSFQTDGQFDQNKYLQALNNPAFAKEWASIENILRVQLPLVKLQGLISSSVRVSESELRQEYTRRNLKLSGKIIYFSPADFPIESITVGDDEIKSYYDAHIDDYKEQEKTKLVYVTFGDAPTKDDSAEVFARIEDVRKQALEGKDFAELAKVYSSEPGAANTGGSLGWFTRGRMVQEFEDACFKAKTGEIVGPVETQFGYHIIKIEETKFKNNSKDKSQDSVKASHVLIRMEPSQTTVETARENANAFYDVAKEAGFDVALEKFAGKFELKPDTTVDIVNNDVGMIAGFPDRLRSVVRFVFSNDVGTATRPFKTNLGFTIFKSISRTQKGIQPLESVREKVKNAVIEEKRKDLAFKKAQDYRAKARSIDEVRLVDTSITIRDLSNFTLSSSIPGVGRDTKINGVLFQLPVGTFADAIKGNRGAYLVQIQQRDEFKESVYQEARRNLKTQLLNTKQQRAYRDWLETTKKVMEIEDFRADFNL
ncbi:peptidylprolyl isomerase [bacterium]|nr:peptidylprolyl isomerase [bacterium]